MIFEPKVVSVNKNNKENLTFFTDLDDTIISNVKNNICVAVKDGNNTSFMSKETYNKFIKLKEKCLVVPVTTRCLESYKNVTLMHGIGNALVDNGAVLVNKDYEIDEEWLKESYELSKSSRENFNKCREILEKYGWKEKWGSDFVLDYVKDSSSEEERNKLEIELVRNGLGLKINVRKRSVVVVFTNLSKGNALDRYIERFKSEPLLSAGDSAEDETMFGSTLLSIGKIGSSAVYTTENDYIVDFVINKATEIIDSIV